MDFTDKNTWIVSTWLASDAEEPEQHNFFPRDWCMGFSFEPLPRLRRLAVLNDGLDVQYVEVPTAKTVPPMVFWFSEIDLKNRLAECNKAFPKYDWMVKQITQLRHVYPGAVMDLNLPKIQYKNACKIENVFAEYCEHYRKWMRPPFIQGGFFQNDWATITTAKRSAIKQFNKWAARYYDGTIEIFELENVNGYDLFDMTYEQMEYETFRQLAELWDLAQTKDLTGEELTVWINEDQAYYSFWGKQNEHGECCTDGRNYHQLKEDNFRALVALPFPRMVVQEVVSWCNPLTSVRIINTVCEWVRRNIAHVFRPNDVPPLKQQAAKVASRRVYTEAELLQIPQECQDLMNIKVFTTEFKDSYFNILTAFYNKYRKNRLLSYTTE